MLNQKGRRNIERKLEEEEDIKDVRKRKKVITLMEN